MTRNYNLAGWLSIGAAILTLPMMGLSITLDVIRDPGRQGLLIPFLLVALSQTAFALFALYRLRDLLRERFEFHGVDALVSWIIGGVVVLTAIGLGGRVATVVFDLAPTDRLPFVVAIAAIGIPTGVLGVVFSIRLMRAEAIMQGLFRPFVWLSLLASLCLASFLLAPIGGLLDAAGNVVLGLIFLRPEAVQSGELEFV